MGGCLIPDFKPKSLKLTVAIAVLGLIDAS